MSYYDYEDYYETSEFDEKIEEFKDYLRESVKKETQDKIENLNIENQRLKKLNEELKERNKTVEDENKAFATEDAILSIITKNITNENVYKVIESIFPKTFNENTNECPEFWSTYVNYYNNKKDVVSLLRYAGVNVPDELDNIVLPHEWDESLLDKFFDTMSCHCNCNGSTYKDNLRYWTYKMAANPFNARHFSQYDEVPWQFVLRNPLLNSEKYALKIAKEINDGWHGLCFTKICTYQQLDPNVLQIIIDNIHVNDKTKKGNLADFLIEHIEMIKDDARLECLYPIISKQWRCDDTILKMPKKYQIQYAKSISDSDKKIEFLNKTGMTKDEKMEVMGELFAD